jgi:3-oxoacyl-[acyl-carrier protein] reductase
MAEYLKRKMALSLKNKNILVTGSSRGIGKNIADTLVKEGARVIYHSSEKADVTDLSSLELMFKKIEKEYGHLDALINNAGWTSFIKHSELENLQQEVIDKIYQVNFRGSLNCIQLALPLLKKSSQASIINISSIAATTAMGSNIVYCAMKAALVNLTKSLARALAPQIRVNSISPGLTDTDLTKDWVEYRQQQIEKTPLQRLGTSEDIAQMCCFLLQKNNFITGQDLIVDGGRTLN